MINVNDFKPGMTFEYKGEIYKVIESKHSKQGRGQANVKAKVKDYRSGTVKVLSFTGGDKVKAAIVSKKLAKYLYNDTDNFIFMDNENYEQIFIPKKIVSDLSVFLIEDLDATIVRYGSEVLEVILPPYVEIQVESAEDGIKGDTTGNARKKAILVTGHEMLVPLFINAGDIVVVNTESGVYDRKKT